MGYILIGIVFTGPNGRVAAAHGIARHDDAA